MHNFFVIVLDGVGIGELPDAASYKDSGSNTLCNIAKAVGGLDLANFEKLGLGNIENIFGLKKVEKPLASYGKMAELSKGKDSTTGHWELAGLYVDTDFSYFPFGFEEKLIKKFLKETGCKGILGNKAASGTEIIKELGEKHMQTGFPIIYTSADSVFQIAAHENVIPLEQLYKICRITREKVLTPPLQVGRVIARPFLGEPGNFKRTTHRRDFSVSPPKPTVLDLLFKNGIVTVGIGKINDLFNYQGIQVQEKTESNSQGFEKLIKYTRKVSNSFIFTNLVDFDVYFGHRNDPEGFAKKLLECDDFLSDFLPNLDETDRLILTADHGNDPTTPSTDHSREYVPLLFFKKNSFGKDLGIRKTFADVGKTVADFFKVDNQLNGVSFLNE